ncbi:MAG: NAD(P)-dependent oxidoreductase [Acidimicrobiales bacterium]|nr:NAD(P)-dependent oxidoreductase [Acidimicrobiales bacterium]
MVTPPRRAVVTAATGFVSGRLVRRLVDEGWEVVAFVRDPGAEAPCPTVAWPRTGSEAVERFAEIRPEVCFHLATRFQPSHRPEDVVALVEGNVTLAALVGEGAAAVAGCHVVYTGSYWQHHDGAAYAPTSLYAATKQAGADVLRYHADCAGVPVTALTLFSSYGPGEPASRITSLLVTSALEQRPVELSPGEQLLDLVYVDDVVDALLVAAADAPGPGWSEASVRSNDPVTLRALAEEVAEVVGRRAPVDFGALPYRPKEMFTPWATAPDLAGWRPATDRGDGLARLAAALGGR